MWLPQLRRLLQPPVFRELRSELHVISLADESRIVFQHP